MFLVEAADDICYKIIDVEDAFKLDRLSFNEAEQLLLALLPENSGYHHHLDKNQSINWLRAKAISELIDQAASAFIENLPQIMDGNLLVPILDKVPSQSLGN